MYHVNNWMKILLVICLLSAASLQAATVAVDPPVISVQPGDVFSLTIAGTDFTTPLDAGGFDLNFDGNVIQPAAPGELPAGVNNIVTLDPLWDVLPPRDPVVGSDALNDIFFFTSSTSPSDFDIAVIWFKAVDTGVSRIILSESQLNPFAGGGAAFTVDLADGQVEVVPIPAAIWLMVSGLLVLTSIGSRPFRKQDTR